MFFFVVFSFLFVFSCFLPPTDNGYIDTPIYCTSLGRAALFCTIFYVHPKCTVRQNYSGFRRSTMALSGFSPYHGLCSGDAQSKIANVTTTSGCEFTLKAKFTREVKFQKMINEAMMLDRRHDRIVHVALRKNAQFVYQNIHVLVFRCFCETDTQINYIISEV